MFKPKGIIPPVITPFTEDEQVNYPVFRQMINHLIDEGVHGIFTMGTCGEFYAVNDVDYGKILEETVSAAEEYATAHGTARVDVYAGANGITTKSVIEKIRICEKVPGIDALSVLTPMFINQTQDELYEHFKRIAGETDMPIIVYNNKPKTNIHVEATTMARLAEIPNIIGIKDSTGDMTNAIDYLRLTKGMPDFSVIMGRDTLIYTSLACGAVGSISSCANVAPRLISDIYDKYVAGDTEGALAAQMAIVPLRFACNMGSFPAVIKESLVQQGFPVGKCMAPIAELTPAEKEKLHKILEEMNVL